MSLKNTQYQIKHGAVLIALTFVTYYTGKYALKGAVALYKLLNPPPPPGPTLAFGKIPHPEIKGLELDNEGVTYQLDTVNGALPQLPTTLTVFAVSNPEPDLLSGAKARNLAISLGFKSQQKELSKTEYLWEESATTRQFKINIASGNFTLTTDSKVLNQKLKAGNTYSEMEAVTRAKGLLSGKGLLPETIAQGIQKTTLVAIDENGNPQKASSLSTAQLVKVDFYRNLQVDKTIYPVFGQNKKANVSLYLSGTGEQEIETPLIYYTTWNPVQETQATYPAKLLATAWEEARTGSAPIVELRLKDADPFAKFKKLNLEKVFIRDVYLAYFEDSEIQDFMIPIYVFEGEAQTTDNQRAYFTAFSWAIDKEWLRD